VEINWKLEWKLNLTKAETRAATEAKENGNKAEKSVNQSGTMKQILKVQSNLYGHKTMECQISITGYV
jgi:hypothetical protein